MQLSATPPPPPSIFKLPRRTLPPSALPLPATPVAQARTFSSVPPPPPRRKAKVDAYWEDLREDSVTDVYSDGPTQVFKKEGDRDEDESTREIPRPTPSGMPVPLVSALAVRAARASAPPPPPPRAGVAYGALLGRVPLPLPPRGYDTISRSLAAASLPSPRFVAALAANEAGASRPRALQPLRVAGGLTAVGVLALIAFAHKPAQGTIVVDARDSRDRPIERLDVFVDGERIACKAAPCSVPDAKGLHEVRVAAEGFEAPATQAVAVASGDATVVHFTVGSPAASGFKVASSQEGVWLTVDGREVGPLPQVVQDLAPGDHTIGLAGSEQYQPIMRHVTVERDKVEDLGTINLKVAKGNVTVLPGTPGAHVFIVNGSDRRELPVLPISLDMDPAKTWSLEATKAGYDDYRQPIDFDDGNANKTYAVTLEPNVTAAPLPPATAAAPRAMSSPSRPVPAALPVTKASPAASPARHAAGAADGGYLNINSLPASTCYLDGTSLGSTPRLSVHVGAGSHTVKFRTPDGRSTRTVVVNVSAGETRLAVARLD
jgi:hypothetical protein